MIDIYPEKSGKFCFSRHITVGSEKRSVGCYLKKLMIVDK
jgi:hypothetical protein